MHRVGRDGEERTEDLGKFSLPAVASGKALRVYVSETEEKQKEVACLDSVGDKNTLLNVLNNSYYYHIYMIWSISLLIP